MLGGPNHAQPAFRRYLHTFSAAFEEGLSGCEIGCRSLIITASASDLGQKIQQGVSLAPTPNRRKTCRGRLAPFEDVLVELVHQDSDIALKDVQGALDHAHGVRASVSRD